MPQEIPATSRWERSVRRSAVAAAVLAFFVLLGIGFALRSQGLPLGAIAAMAVGGAAGAYRWATGPIRRRRALLAQPFPAAWNEVLERDVAFFRALDADEKERFRRAVQVFLGEKRVTGIQVELDDTTRVLVAASAVIPIFGFPEWEWHQIREVLIYPGRFDHEFSFDGGAQQRILGMVGTGVMNRVMILSQPDLIAGFRNPGDRRNVALHEFAHLVDKSDGAVDGLPAVGLDRATVGPWMELVRRKMTEMRNDESDIDLYGLTNESEFFAVASEYFFERPGVLERKHPELYAMLAQVFRQDLKDRATALRRKPRAFGRNDPCPCGSGLKYKRCCLR
ncbi:MAG: zinc-dependent peptidase [Planctomycetota bacterium]